MTMMQHILLRLPAGDRTLKSYAAAWGDKWWERAEHIGYLQGCPWDSPGVGDGGSKEAQLGWLMGNRLGLYPHCTPTQNLYFNNSETGQNIEGNGRDDWI